MREFLEVQWHNNVCSRQRVINGDKLSYYATWVCDTLSGVRANCLHEEGKKCRHSDCWDALKKDLEDLFVDDDQ